MSTMRHESEAARKSLLRELPAVPPPRMVSRMPVTMNSTPNAKDPARLPGGIDVVLFDVGHTLVHTNLQNAWQVVNEVTAAVHRQVAALGFTPPALSRYIRTAKWRFLSAAVWSRIIRREVQVIEMIRHAHARMGIHLDSDQTRDLAVHGAIAIWDLFSVDPDASAMLGELSRRGYRLGLISNTWLPGILFDGYLKHEGLLDYFPLRVYSSEFRYMKPDRRIFDHALNELKVTPQQCMFVGDRLDNDVRGPARLGMRTIHFAVKPRRFWQRGAPDHTIHRLSEVPDVLSSLA